MNSLPGHVSAKKLLVDIAALRRGDAGAGDRLSIALWAPVNLAVVRILGDNALDREDVIHDSLLAALDFFKRDLEFQGNPVKLAVTIARNRCIDIIRKRSHHPEVDLAPMVEWIADPGKSALDDLERDELLLLLQEALNHISYSCGQLLRSLYLLKVPTEAIRLQLGLESVHAVYYRRENCLQEAKKFLQKGLVIRSGNGGGREIGTNDLSEDQ